MMPLVLLSMLLAPEVVSAAVLRPLHAPMSRAVLWPRMPLPYMKADDDVPADAEPEAEVAATAEAAVFEEATDPFGMEMDEGSIAREALKAEVSEGLSGSAPDRAVLGEILLSLEAQNPTKSPATSPLLNGKWRIVYATGASPGLKALQLVLKGAKRAPKSPSGADLVDFQDAYLQIKEEQPRAETSVRSRFLSFENTVKLQSKSEAESAIRRVETYEAAESEYMSLRLPFQSPLQYKRSLLISYLDDEILIVRDAMGRPDILLRCDEPSAWDPRASGEDGNATDDETPSA